MSPDELAWRARQAGRTAAQLLTFRVRPPRWHRNDLRHVVADGVLAAVLPSGEDDSSWQPVHDELRRRILQRTSRFTLDPAAAAHMRDAVSSRWPAAASDAAARAESILAGRYDVLGYHQLAWNSPDGAVDWHLDPVADRAAPRQFWATVPYLDPSSGDHKVIWELNRHQHWLQLGRALWLTGDRRCRQALIQQLEGWLAANPPLVGINWASMLEIGLRGLSWMWALHFLLPGERTEAEPPWLIDMFVALDRQLNHVEQNLSIYFSPNTHLTGEALGLYAVGVALPELAGSSRWRETGRTILIDEIGRQIRADGGHVERSTHYQRYTLDFYLMALLTAQRDHDAEAVALFRDAVTRLAEYTRAMADDRGRLPLIGDDDGGMLWRIAGRACHDVRDSLSLAAVLLDRPDLAPWGLQEEVVWIAGPRALEREHIVGLASGTAAPAVSRTLRDSGFVVLRDDAGSHATFDVGRHGHANGGHAHAGALAITLGLHGQPLLIDPGTCTYTMDARIRDLFRSTVSHNTVIIDDRSQAIPGGPFHWQTRGDAHLHGSRSNDRFGWAEAWHDAYMPIRHRRTFVRTARGEWLIADEILGDGHVTARAHWHLDPGWTLRSDAPGRFLARHGEGHEAWLLHDNGDCLLAHGDDELGLGWYAPVYGALVPTWTMRTTRKSNAPFALLTYVCEKGAAASAPSLERLSPAPDSQGNAIGVRVGDARGGSVFLLRPGEACERDGRTCRIADYETNACVLHYEEADGHLLALDVIDATRVLALRPNWISIAAAEPIADLHVSWSNDALDLCSSQPPGELRLQGAAVRTVRQVRLNRRLIDVRPSGHPENLVVNGGDWASAAQCPEPQRADRPRFAASAIAS
jgi:uncharacterized heparinase superfamily protein